LNMVKMKDSCGFRPTIGVREKRVLDDLEAKRGITILRQWSVPGTRYTVDGYCLETNTVFEVFEETHALELSRDCHRANRIQQALGCDLEVIWLTPERRYKTRFTYDGESFRVGRALGTMGLRVNASRPVHVSQFWGA